MSLRFLINIIIDHTLRLLFNINVYGFLKYVTCLEGFRVKIKLETAVIADRVPD